MSKDKDTYFGLYEEINQTCPKKKIYFGWKTPNTGGGGYLGTRETASQGILDILNAEGPNVKDVHIFSQGQRNPFGYEYISNPLNDNDLDYIIQTLSREMPDRNFIR